MTNKRELTENYCLLLTAVLVVMAGRASCQCRSGYYSNRRWGTNNCYLCPTGCSACISYESYYSGTNDAECTECSDGYSLKKSRGSAAYCGTSSVLGSVIGFIMIGACCLCCIIFFVMCIKRRNNNGLRVGPAFSSGMVYNNGGSPTTYNSGALNSIPTYQIPGRELEQMEYIGPPQRQLYQPQSQPNQGFLPPPIDDFTLDQAKY